MEAKRCPICKGEMVVDYGTNSDYDRGYFLVCEKCSLLFGFSEDERELGDLCGKYSDEGAAIKAWNEMIEKMESRSVDIWETECGRA